MPTIMTLQSVGGTFTFDANEMPLLGRQVAYERPSDQGYVGSQKILCTLNGFFAANKHAECIARHQALLAVVKANDAVFTYTVDGTTIIQERVYIDGYNEPADWKEYEGDYSLSFHYFEAPRHSAADLGIVCSYVPAQGAMYTFETTPNWGGSLSRNRQDWRIPRTTPGGRERTNHVSISLVGRLYAPDHGQLAAKMDALTAAFNYEGTLNYGVWTKQVRVEGIQFAQNFPRNYADYTIALHYDLPDGLIEFRSTRKYGRIHAYPIIKEKPFCGSVKVRQFQPSGQDVNYFIYVRATTLILARQYAAAEAAVLIAPGGVEQPGGSEDEDDTELSVSISCTKYHYPAIHFNSAGT